MWVKWHYIQTMYIMGNSCDVIQGCAVGVRHIVAWGAWYIKIIHIAVSWYWPRKKLDLPKICVALQKTNKCKLLWIWIFCNTKCQFVTQFLSSFSQLKAAIESGTKYFNYSRYVLLCKKQKTKKYSGSEYFAISTLAPPQTPTPKHQYKKQGDCLAFARLVALLSHWRF